MHGYSINATLDDFVLYKQVQNSVSQVNEVKNSAESSRQCLREQ